MTITLTLTEEEAEILGYALGIAKRDQDQKAARAAPASMVREGCRERAWRIEQVRFLLDAAPIAA